MSRPTPPRVVTGWWRNYDGTPEVGVRIKFGLRHVHIEPHNVRALADALHDWADKQEEEQQ